MTDEEQKEVFSKNLSHYISIFEKTQKEVADAISVSPQTFNTWTQGIALPRMGKIQSLANYFNINKSDLLDKHDFDLSFSNIPNIYPIELKRFPLLGEIACGEPRFANEDRESYVEASTDIRADFCLKARGDSMINARINDGDIVFIREQPSVYNGEIAAVVIDDEATLKRVFYYPEKDLFILKAENPKYDDLIYSKSELDNIRILGKAIAFQSDVV